MSLLISVPPAIQAQATVIRAPQVLIFQPNNSFTPYGRITLNVDPAEMASLTTGSYWIRVLPGELDSLKSIASVRAPDSCITITGAWLLPATQSGNSLTVGSVSYAWLRQKAGAFSSTYYTLRLEKDAPGDPHGAMGAPLKIRRADLQKYLVRAVEILIVPGVGAIPGHVELGSTTSRTAWVTPPCVSYDDRAREKEAASQLADRDAPFLDSFDQRANVAVLLKEHPC